MLDYGGTFRVRDPKETIATIKPLLRGFGITRVANVTGLDVVGVPVWCAIRPLSRSLTVSQGKGITDELAAISAAMEAIELHHAESCVPSGIRVTIKEADGNSEFADPVSLPIRSDANFDVMRDVEWITARNVASGEIVYVPRELIDRDSLVSRQKDYIFYSSSNGLASGNSQAEAIVHGLSEVIERDQLAFWQVRKELTQNGRDTKVQIDTIDDERCQEIIDKVRAAGLEINVWLATTNISVPTFTCSVWDSKMKTPYPFRAGGHGTHPYKRVAILRAVTEALQSRLTHIAGGRDDMYWEKYSSILPTYLPQNQKYISYIREEAESIDYRAIPEAPKLDSIDGSLRWLLEKVKADASSDCLVVDLTREGSPVHVVQVIVPGLELSAKRNFYSPGKRMMAFLRERAIV